MILALDTATPATVVGVARASGELLAERRHDPAPGERPGHQTRLLALCDEALREAGVAWNAVARVGVGVGPGTFTGLRIGVASARALAQGLDVDLVGISTLEALALTARAEHDGPVAAVLDARRGEAFVAVWDAHGARVLDAAAWPPDRLPELHDVAAASAAGAASPALLAVGDGALRFREVLEAAGVIVPADGATLHRVAAAALCETTARAPVADRDAVVPEYVRLPDAVPRP